MGEGYLLEAVRTPVKPEKGRREKLFPFDRTYLGVYSSSQLQFSSLCYVGIAQWLERQTRDRKVAGRIPGGAAGEFSSPGSTFCADSYFGIRSTPVLPQ